MEPGHDMKPRGRPSEKMEHLAQIVQVAYHILAVRFMTLLSLFLQAGIFAWAISTESWVRLAGAAVFSVANWCILNLKPPKGD